MSTSTATKRKSGAATTASKRARVDDSAQSLVNAILDDSDGYSISENPDNIRKSLVDLALYARSLEEEIAASKPKKKTKEQLEAAADKLRTAAVSGIRKQMAWKPSCKTGTAKWSYDGVCADAEVFGQLLGLGGAPIFKTKKMTIDEFQDAIGDVSASIRYGTLNLTGSGVNIQWKADLGTFKFSGMYGK